MICLLCSCVPFLEINKLFCKKNLGKHLLGLKILLKEKKCSYHSMYCKKMSPSRYMPMPMMVMSQEQLPTYNRYNKKSCSLRQAKQVRRRRNFLYFGHTCSGPNDD